MPKRGGTGEAGSDRHSAKRRASRYAAFTPRFHQKYAARVGANVHRTRTEPDSSKDAPRDLQDVGQHLTLKAQQPSLVETGG